MAKVKSLVPVDCDLPNIFFSFRRLTLTFKYIYFYYSCVACIGYPRYPVNVLRVLRIRLYRSSSRRPVEARRSRLVLPVDALDDRATLYLPFLPLATQALVFFVDWFKIKHENIWLVAFIIRLGCFLRICSLNVKINNMFNNCNWVGCGINGGANNTLRVELGDITSFNITYLLLTYVSLIILFVYCIVLYLEKILYLYYYPYSFNLIF